MSPPPAHAPKRAWAGISLVAALLIPLLPGTVAHSQGLQPQPSEGKRVGAWMYSCQPSPCRAFVGLRGAGAEELTLTLQKDAQSGKIVLAIRVPLGTVLPPGVRIFIAEDDFIPLHVQICRQAGCDAAILLDDDTQARLSAASSVKIAFFGQPRPEDEVKGLQYEMPFHGLGEVAKMLEASGR